MYKDLCMYTCALCNQMSDVSFVRTLISHFSTPVVGHKIWEAPVDPLDIVNPHPRNYPCCNHPKWFARFSQIRPPAQPKK